MWLTVVLLLFSASPLTAPAVDPLDENSVAAAAPSGLVHVSFDGGERWIAVAHCPAAPELSWNDGDLRVACGDTTLLDGDELRAHWSVLAAAPSLVGEQLRFAASRSQQRRARLRAWLPDVELAVRRDWSSDARSSGRAIAAETTFLVLLRWRLEPTTFGTR